MPPRARPQPSRRTARSSAPQGPLLAAVARYYGGKVARHGPTAPGADWSGEASQELRFAKLLQVCDFSGPATLNDVGCGWGALLGYLRGRYPFARVDYLGVDIATEMVRVARRRWAGARDAAFVVADRSPRVADYSVASGVFNVKLDATRAEWEALVRAALEAMAQTSTRGLAVNFLAPEPAHLAQAPQLYRTEPEPWERLLGQLFGGRVEVVGGYGLSEFTLLAYR